RMTAAMGFMLPKKLESRHLDFYQIRSAPAAAILVFLARTAGAWVVASDFRAGANGLGFGDGFAGLGVHFRAGLRVAGRTAAEGGDLLVDRLLRELLQELLKSH